MKSKLRKLKKLIESGKYKSKPVVKTCPKHGVIIYK